VKLLRGADAKDHNELATCASETMLQNNMSPFHVINDIAYPPRRRKRPCNSFCKLKVRDFSLGFTLILKNKITVEFNSGKKCFHNMSKCNTKGVFSFPEEELIDKLSSNNLRI